MAGSPGKRDRDRQKLEKVRLKAERKAARQSAQPEPTTSAAQRTEPEIIEDLGALQLAFEAGELSPEEFEDRRDLLRTQLEQLI